MELWNEARGIPRYDVSSWGQVFDKQKFRRLFEDYSPLTKDTRSSALGVRPMTRDELMHYGTKRHSGRYLPMGLR